MTPSTISPSRTSSAAIPVALDLDLALGAPGSDIDDRFALALAVGAPGIDLRLVSTVNGNTDVPPPPR